MMRWSHSVAVALSTAAVFSVAPGFSLRAGDDRPRVICHKGECAEAPENTLPAFQLVIDRGLPAFECDIRVSKDGGLFCYHDNDMSRFGGSPDRTIENSTSAELEAYDAGAYVGDRWKGTKMPQLKDILALARDGLVIQVELKMDAAGVPLVKAEFARHPEATPGRVMFATGDLDTIAALKREMPDYKVYWIHGTYWAQEEHVVWPTTWELFQDLKKADVKPDGVALAGQPIMDYKYWGDFKRAGYEVCIWTIDDPKEVKRYLDDGVDWVTTNYGKLCSDYVLGERAKEKEEGLLKQSDESAELRLDSGVWSASRSDWAAADSRLFTRVETTACPIDSSHIGFLLFLR